MDIDEADVEARSCLGGNEVDGLVADVDRSEFEVRRIEMAAALIEPQGHERAHERDEPADRILGKLGIGDVALPAADDQRAVERAASTDLDGVAEFCGIARLAENA